MARSNKNDKKSKPTHKHKHQKTLEDYLADEEAIEEVKQSLANPAEARPKSSDTSVQGQWVERTFGAEDQTALSENEHYRFFPASNKVGHALIQKNEHGQLVATQFKAPGTLEPDAPQIIPLKDIQLVYKFGALRAMAKAEDGTPMISKRLIDVETNVGTEYAQKGQLMYFSPETSHRWHGSVFWGGDDTAQPPLFRSNLSKELKKDLEAELKAYKPEVRGGKETINAHDILIRDEQKRNPDQNTVMKGSAIDAYRDYREEYDEELSSEMKAIFDKAEAARPFYQGGGFKTQSRPEWLHAVGFGLTPLDKNPQKPQNLAAAAKHLNTKMMVTERALKWNALNRPNGHFEVEAQFDMLPNSDLMKKGMIEGTFEEGGKTLKLHQDLNPFAKYPNFNKPTDIAQTTLATHHLLTDVAPLSVTPVLLAPGVPLERTPYQDTVLDSGASTGVQSNTQQPNTQQTQEHTSRPGGVMPTAKSQKTKPTKANHKRKTLVSDPTVEDLSYEKSIVQITSSFYDHDYDTPWMNSSPMSSTGSGFVIERNGKRYILTNAHVVENSGHLQVRLADDNASYVAKPLQISFQSDIALLEVTDKEFIEKTKPLVIGPMVKTKDKVNVVGFPMGGTEVSTTKGIISRIGVDVYSLSGEYGLQAQTDSAINPGNSGGPVFSGNQVVGIAFQGISQGDGLGYIIPSPVIHHFLEDYFKPGPYQGFPTLNIGYQELSNQELKAALGLAKHQSGVRVISVDTLSDAKSKLKKGDILTAVDGISISNDGKCDLDGIGKRIDLEYLFKRKHIGDTVSLSVLRLNEATNKYQPLNVEVALKFKPGDTKLVTALEHEKSPTYFVCSGMVFQPVTQNYLLTGKGKALREMITPKHGYISDTPKKKIDEEMVIISTIFDSEFTKGYDFYENNPVKSINGKKIDNIRQALEAFESNTNPYHKIEIASGELLVVKNLSQQEHKSLLKRYGRIKDCSEDLKPFKQSAQSAPVTQPRTQTRTQQAATQPQQVQEDRLSLAQKLLDLLLGNDASSLTQQLLSEPTLSPIPDKKSTESTESLSLENTLTQQLFSGDLSEELGDEDSYSDATDEDEYEIGDFVVADEAVALGDKQKAVVFSDLTGGNSGGLRTYRDTLNRLAQRYGGGQHVLDSDDDESYSESLSDSGASSCSDSDSSIEEDVRDSLTPPPSTRYNLRGRRVIGD